MIPTPRESVRYRVQKRHIANQRAEQETRNSLCIPISNIQHDGGKTSTCFFSENELAKTAAASLTMTICCRGGAGWPLLLLGSSSFFHTALAFVVPTPADRSRSVIVLKEEWRENIDQDANLWVSSDTEDWEAVLLAKNTNKQQWESSFETDDNSSGNDLVPAQALASTDDADAAAESWLDTLQSLTAEEVEFNTKEADRADKVRQMEEWGFTSETIANTLGVATSTELEVADEVEGMQSYRQESYLDTVDLETVESHLLVEKDEETGTPIRSQMVYVDEHACIGCTNCAMIAQSTFFMHAEQGRARVFQQWGDDDETIQIAIETCPVDCIHYIPFDELVRLEEERRDQNINFKARLVNSDGNGSSHLTGGGQFTAPQEISSNLLPRCNNCPSKGCKNCPMFGVGDNPYFKKREEERLAKREKRRLLALRKEQQKSAEF